MKITTSSDVFNAWNEYTLSTVGETLPMNFIAQEEGQFVIGHECDEEGPPMVTHEGVPYRRISMALGFARGEVLWS